MYVHMTTRIVFDHDKVRVMMFLTDMHINYFINYPASLISISQKNTLYSFHQVFLADHLYTIPNVVTSINMFQRAIKL